ncbi:MAG TPA: carboxymuconolactone decarboxylase family protein [Thermodesulfobacteriota bacterium]
MNRSLYEAGKAVRSEVLGPEYVEKSLALTDEFNEPWQDLLTEYCWGAIWTRPGLDRRTRSLLNLAMLAVLGRSHELGLHIRGALRNGATKEEIREALMQAAVYGGVPAGVEAFRTANAVFAEQKA